MGSSYSAFGKIWLNYSYTADNAGHGGTAADNAGRSGRTAAVPATDGGGGGFTVELIWESKTPTRLPESVWLETRPLLANSVQEGAKEVRAGAGGGVWKLHVDKLGTMVDVEDVVVNGGAALHGLSPSGAMQWSRSGNSSNSGSKFSVWSLDAASVAPGKNVNLWAWDAYNNGTTVNPTDGAAFCLWNNLWSVAMQCTLAHLHCTRVCARECARACARACVRERV